jgi:FMN phosphatase YigB (HAD superfamily)
MQHFIFDLDDTIINSKHRYKTLPNGDIDLAHWLKVAKIREQVFRDTLLPLSKIWYGALALGATVTIATARTMSRHDFDFLKHHKLHHHHAVYRRNGDNSPDALLKAEGLISLFNRAPHLRPERSVMYDDNTSVRESIGLLGIRTIDPVPLNKRMAASAA